MNLEKIKMILAQPIDDQTKESLIIDELAKDESVIPSILKIIDKERKRKKEVLTEMNVLLSKIEVALSVPKLNKDNFMQEEVYNFYQKYNDQVSHCFKTVNP